MRIVIYDHMDQIIGMYASLYSKRTHMHEHCAVAVYAPHTSVRLLKRNGKRYG